MEVINENPNELFWNLIDDLQQFDLGDSDASVGEWRNIKALNMNKAGVVALTKKDNHLKTFRLQAYVAIPESVGFIGLAFGARDPNNYELIYLSPGNDGIGELQYDPVMNGSTTWQIYNGPDYLAQVPYAVGEWVKFTVDVHRNSARIYVGDTSSPQLTISSLQHGSVDGKIGIWGYLPGYIRDLSFEELPILSSVENTVVKNSSEDFVTDWLVSDPYINESQFNGDHWTNAVTEENGTLNLNRLFTSEKDLSVQVKSTITVLEDTQSTISFGFSDYIRLWINEQEIYQGTWMWNPPDNDGRIRPDHISIPVTWRAGENSIRAEVTSKETVFGWGFCLKTGISLS